MAQPLDRQELLPEVAVAQVRLPRDRQGNSPQAAAVMLLASYGLSPQAWFPSAVLVALLVDLGTTEAGARAVLHRLTRRGVLEGRREGRRTSYRLTTPAAVGLARGGQSLVTFATVAEQWDGQWTLVAFSVPGTADAERAVVRSRLRWRGFVPLYDGLWVSPEEPDDQLNAMIAGSAEVSFTIFRAQAVAGRGPGEDMLRLWDVDAVAAAYEGFLATWEPIAEQVRAGALTGAAALRARVDIEEEYRRFVVLEPRFPLAVMPQGWPRGRAHDVFVTVFDGLAQAGADRIQEVAAALGAAPLALAPHSSAELAAGWDAT